MNKMRDLRVLPRAMFEKRNAKAELIDDLRCLKACVRIILFQEFAEGALADRAKRFVVLDELTETLQQLLRGRIVVSAGGAAAQHDPELGIEVDRGALV